MTPEHEEVIKATRDWVNTIVVGLNLCPFARSELARKRVQFRVSDALTAEQLILDLQDSLLEIASSNAIETTLLIHPGVLQNFNDYNQFLDVADALLVELELEGIYQIASFHPSYQFAGTEVEDARNYSNKSPYPMLHLISEDSLEKAIENTPDVHLIPERNHALLEELGIQHLKNMLEKNKTTT